MQAMFNADERMGKDVDSWIIDNDGTIYYHNGTVSNGNLMDEKELMLSFTYLSKADSKGEYSAWMGGNNSLKLDQEYIIVRPIYEKQLYLIMYNRCGAVKELQHSQFKNLVTADLILLIAVIAISSYIFASYRSRLILLATTDELTGLSNRKSFDSLFEEYVRDRQEGDLSLFLLDIDYFKQINDNYGHAAGDRALQHLGSEIKSMVQGRLGFAGRWGGDEFIGVMPVPAEEALLELSMLCRRIQSAKMQDGFTMTISAGVVHTKKETSLSTLSERADQALYQSKESGRNRATLADCD
jgi:diguanylate cyclase (GGDEF)-like protein